ncbi:MAG: KEOPS complex subunit Cgi121 [Halobacteriales archaeon]
MRILHGRLGADDVDETLGHLEAVAMETGATVQAFDARYLVGPEHLHRAVELADRAIDRGQAVADDRAVEILLYAAGRRQIDEALGMGLSDPAAPVAVVVDGGDEATAAERVRARLAEEHDPEGIAPEAARVVDFFDVTEAELATGADLRDLVLERVALLAVNR